MLKKATSLQDFTEATMNQRACLCVGLIPLLGSPSPQPSPARREREQEWLSDPLSRLAGEGWGEGSEGPHL